jgi:hypothetical protein
MSGNNFNAVEVRPICPKCGCKSVPVYATKGMIAYRRCGECGNQQKFVIQYPEWKRL